MSVEYKITGETRLAGVMGWPVEHSRSPLMHNYWCQTHGVNGAYVPLPTPPDEFETALKGLRAAGFRGVNVTIPHKEAAMAACDRLTDTARRAGAVNTVIFSPEEIVGDCTDGSGFCENLVAHGVTPQGRALILGAGGAARAVAAALLDCGCEVLIANRTLARAEALVQALEGGEAIAWHAWPALLSDCSLLINATALGMKGASPDWSTLLHHAGPSLAVADIVYTPRDTPLLQAAEAKGLKTVDGLGMLIQQARVGFEAWFGVKPEVDDAVFELLAASLR
ncbi:shikimate 5-dehydrogenase [Neokomagataea thailandica NBRC 106555]|uniref:Shikimate dehydrogenase (NADP(+)) n=2 Tax=Neokomagataea TaxID=1223423 RepID=A0A4Y6V6V3_9PROT|nr:MULTISPECIES: shikimate dehydrogenase [Neokomagataea]QDH24390.1 shikimate dehydrogenase [Neokomagataea tanensis]GBR53375.1 shikimate 5-dehydrogenase [Neokomagataea thailandica NBRC 106555]